MLPTGNQATGRWEDICWREILKIPNQFIQKSIRTYLTNTNIISNIRYVVFVIEIPKYNELETHAVLSIGWLGTRFVHGKNVVLYFVKAGTIILKSRLGLGFENDWNMVTYSEVNSVSEKELNISRILFYLLLSLPLYLVLKLRKWASPIAIITLVQEESIYLFFAFVFKPRTFTYFIEPFSLWDELKRKGSFIFHTATFMNLRDFCGLTRGYISQKLESHTGSNCCNYSRRVFP